jgi:hypothetical protein
MKHYFIGFTIMLSMVVLGTILKVWNTAAERVIFENSFQYTQGMQSRALVLQAQIAQIDANIINNPSLRSSLLAQRKVLELQLQATNL